MAAPHAAQGGSARKGARTARARVLVVDDEPMLGTTLRLLLSDRYDVDVVTSVADARARLAAGSYDVILCDLMLPIATGMDLFRELAASDPAAASSIVFMTGGAYDDTARRFLETVPNRRLDKPFDPGALADLLDAQIAARR
jgi:DNA-binding response OmpR family regulator